MKKYYFFYLFVICVNFPLWGQKFSEAIEDNSFLIEEAYNQDDNVIQHISTGYYMRENKDFFYTFTQEWPFFSHLHQVSFSLPYSWLKSSNSNGLGDIMINYRYQLFDSDDWAAVSPRLSVILPTGNEKASLGNGVVGFQAGIPVSKRVSEYFSLHFNAGTTILPGIKTVDLSGSEKKETLTSFYLGGSIIWLAHSKLNVMLEYIYSYNNVFNPEGEKEYKGTGILNPGLRYAINLGELQIVPGVALPISFTEQQQQTDLFFYLSFEHPLKFY